jgi:predicted DNA-binding protein (MmcQ/YjbR family)
MASPVRRVRAELREFALGLPEAHEDLPWGERVAKVKKKVFVFLGRDMDTHLGLSVKLRASHQSALAMPFTQPTGYGLGKSGWVSAKFDASSQPSLELLRAWVKESYCAVAPKSLAALVSSSAAPAKKAPAKKAPAKKAPAKKKKAVVRKAPARKPQGRGKSVAQRTSLRKRAPKR